MGGRLGQGGSFVLCSGAVNLKACDGRLSSIPPPLESWVVGGGDGWREEGGGDGERRRRG